MILYRYIMIIISLISVKALKYNGFQEYILVVVNGKIRMYIWGCGQNPGPNRLLLGGLQCIRMKRESKQ